MVQKTPVILCIMDGWGLSDTRAFNAVEQAQTPVFDRMMTTYPASRLVASELAVGLPKGQPGNSEVGHMTIGAGRVILQDLPRLSKACSDGSLAEMAAFQKFCDQMRKTGGRAHLVGLTSEGGVHSHSDHILALATALRKRQIPVTLHILTDGRDTLPKQAEHSLPEFLRKLPDGCQIASLCGRYFAMDRDNRWERTGAFLDLVITGQVDYHCTDLLEGLKRGYDRGETDEFIQPTCLASYQGMEEGDGLFITNFRVDRVRQLAYALLTPRDTGYRLPKNAKIDLPFTGPILSATPQLQI